MGEQTEIKVLKLSDNVIAQIVKLLQLGLITGTDVTDHFRTLRVVVAEDNLVEPDPDYMIEFEENVNKMLAEAEISRE
jgi:hypothetical protein